MKKSKMLIGVVALALVGSANLCAGSDPLDGQAADSSVQNLSEAQLHNIRKRVLKRCGLSSRLASNRLPWYFHYEFGVELVRLGAPAEAVEPLQMTANLKPEPARDARMYGAWFVNYQPYYQMSLAYSDLGQWDAAWDAIRISENLVEFAPGEFEYDKFESLKSRITRNRQEKTHGT